MSIPISQVHQPHYVPDGNASCLQPQIQQTNLNVMHENKLTNATQLKREREREREQNQNKGTKNR